VGDHPEERSMQAFSKMGTTPTLRVGIALRLLDFTKLIDNVMIGKGKHGIPMALKRWYESAEESRRPPVVVVKHRDVLSPRKAEAGYKVVEHVKIAVLLDPPYPRVRNSRLKLTCVVWIPVVRDHDLEVVE
jgi:hypothetical protein